MKKMLLYSVLCAAVMSVRAQGTVELLRFSQVYHSGTARFSAMGGAFTALGSDASSLVQNPGGLGVYRGSEFAFTPHLLGAYNTAEMDGSPYRDSKFKFGLSNFSGIFAFEMGNSLLRYLNFGFGYNKTNHFADASMVRSSTYGVGERATMSDYFAAIANDLGKPHYELGSGDGTAWLAWEGYAIDSVGPAQYGSPYLAGERVRDERRSTTKGLMGEYDFSMGGNVGDVFYFGMTIVVTELEYEETRTTTEKALEVTPSKNDYRQRFAMNGSGYNFKFGVVVTPFVNAEFATGLRVGAALHTPTFWEVEDRYDEGITFVGNKTTTADLPTNEFMYRIVSPFRYMAGVAYVFAGEPLRGIVSLDYEYVDYSAVRMREHRDYANDMLTNINNSAAEEFKSTANVRVGGELGYKQYSLRGGFAHYGDAYRSDVGKSSAVNVLSLGVGVRYFRNHYIDFAYTRSMFGDEGYLYHYNDALRSEKVVYDLVQNNFLVTFGWKF